MKYVPNQIYHVFNQGNNRQKIFFTKRNYYFFIKKFKQQCLPYVDVLCYCLMPNHFHFLLMVNKVGCTYLHGSSPIAGNQQRFSRSLGTLLSSYTRAINKQEGRTGSLFRAKTKAKDGWIDGFITVDSKEGYRLFRPDNDYARTCFDYIHINPVEAGLVKRPTDWPFSSARDYAGLSNGTFCHKELALELELCRG